MPERDWTKMLKWAAYVWMSLILWYGIFTLIRLVLL